MQIYAELRNLLEDIPLVWRKRSARSLEIQLKKNQLFISDGSRVIHLLMKPCNLAFLQKR
jgi:hypothetical protein